MRLRRYESVTDLIRLTNYVKDLLDDYKPYLKKLEVYDCLVRGEGSRYYYKFKEKVAKRIARDIISLYPGIEEVYYSDLSRGHPVLGSNETGRDLDLIIILEGDMASDKKEKIKSELSELEKILDKIFREELSNTVLSKILNNHNFIEFHVDDIYARRVNNPLSDIYLASKKVYP